MTREFAPERTPESKPESQDEPQADITADPTLATDKARIRRNQCAIAAILLYALFNIVGLTILRTPQQYAYRYADWIYRAVNLTGFAMIGLYIGFCCNGARARGWSVWAGLPIALLGLVIWFGAAFFILFQNANTPTSITNQARVYDDRVPALVVVAIIVAAVTLRLLPNRVPKLPEAVGQ